MNQLLLRFYQSIVLVFLLAVVSVFLPTHVFATGTAADAICFEPGMCQYGTLCGPGGPPGVLNKPCGESTNGFGTYGVCVAPKKCLAKSSDGQNGDMQGMQQALQALQQMLQQMKGGGGGGGGSGSGTGTDTTGPGGCTQYYNVTTPSSDPCAVYVPPVSDTLGSTTGSSAASDLISSLLGGGYANNNVQTQPTTNQQTGTTQNTSNQSASSTRPAPTQSSNVTNAPAQLVPGVSGDIQYSSSNVTVLVNNVDTKAGTQVAGFYGTNANGQPTSVVSGMCQSRPWATNFLAFIIPGTFFDSLCELRGYKVGTPAAATPVVKIVKKVQTVVKAATTTAATSTGPYIPPQADIWAVPASVPLGSRTTVFWNAKGVTSCAETSPDGSFSQNTLSGGAATVPLSGATTYTISCLTPAGDHITNYATVNLSAN